ncbi:hypothetical protein M011DRAFT_485976 [Sporormia fimetaria CBS 119925]|uniref:PHD-type domain-containing protein n=1 Tax=Sporormia fimetaria CBS 119925 TaxID=1340428 RepID=A0A6A6VEX1_9PLEO|nr:hypothetical protein M011DRAFT_485976 [Sporormia fimetaria CBS 119925]
MAPRKRLREETEDDAAPSQSSTMLSRLRNMWQFANLAQFLHLFHDALRLDKDVKDFDIDTLESECLMPQPSEKLAKIGLVLLKHVSSHKGLTLEIFDEYTRRQFVAKAPDRNPFGTDETPNKFDDFDVYTKIKVLQQLSVWTMKTPTWLRERLGSTDAEMINWRVEPCGWDSKDRTLIILDDNRMYRQTEPPPPPPKSKSKAKAKKSGGTRASKRRKTTATEAEDVHDEEDAGDAVDADRANEPEDDGLGGMKWECLCVTMEDYQTYMSSIRRSKHPDEKNLYAFLEEEVMPVLQQQAEERARKEAQKLREAEKQMLLATAKRSGRLAMKQEKRREEEEAAEAERKRQEDLAMARAEQERQRKLEKDMDSRRMTREQRVREREAKRILEEETLRKLKEDEEKLNQNDSNFRISERHLLAEMRRREKELLKLKKEDDWEFDCEVCHVHGIGFDDGTESIACDRCNVWQHLKCHNISKEQADREDFHFVCTTCKRKEEEAKQPKLPSLKLKLNSDPQNTSAANGSGSLRHLTAVAIPAPRPSTAVGNGHGVQPAQGAASLLSGPSLSPRGQAHGPPGIQRSEAAYGLSDVHPNSKPSSRLFQAQRVVDNGFPPSSPPQGTNVHSRPYSGFPTNFPDTNGTAPTLSNLAGGSYLPSNGASFSRPSSSADVGPFSSPVKRTPVPSPKPTNGVSNYSIISTPHSSFPLNAAQPLSFSPTKHSSPPPPLPYHSSPAPMATPLPHPSAQHPAKVLPDPIPAPEKHDVARLPASSQSFSQTNLFPPVQALSPNVKPQNLSPPVKKMSPAPTPERPQFLPTGGYRNPMSSFDSPGSSQ